MAVKIAYYAGNTARAASSEVEDCIQPLCKTLGIQLIELPKASSDGGNIIKQSSPKLQHALVARNLALAEAKKVDVLTTCATSYGIMCDTVDEFSRDHGFANSVNNLVARTTGIEYQGESKPRHLLHFLVEEIGLETIRDAVINPIRMDVAAYYGPNMQRDGATSGDDAFMPTYLEQLIVALGGTPVDY
ncbi:MAG: hypothetical protein L7S46_07895, partial [Candidatus Poseidoniaceae archaeon]|nr:hypothetical protein [Candidatus Poseidoniaceae archaeon]